jgi:hypothetical protein
MTVKTTTPTRLVPAVVGLLLMASLCGCGKSAQQLEQERLAREAAVQKAIADSVAEERAKDQRMLESAAAEASERIAREERQRNPELEKAAASDAAARRAEQQRAAEEGALRIYTDKLRYSSRDPASVEMRNAQLAPNRNGMCAEFNAKDKNGRLAGFKRVVVTDASVTPEEPPNRETLTLFLLFQIAARDTGCFPDVAQLKIMQ